ncbi:MAG: hypothetical protein AAGC88_03345 [Bacteroidota bacterium]
MTELYSGTDAEVCASFGRSIDIAITYNSQSAKQVGDGLESKER